MPGMFTELPDLAALRLGGAVLAANDEFFAEKENLLKPGKPEWREGEYTDRGKWMDGWETRRRRTPGHDWAVVKLGLPGRVRGVVIDTSYFTGNYPEAASLDAWTGAADLPEGGGDAGWVPLLPKSQLAGDRANLFEVSGSPERVTHLRLNIFPDGGVARLRVHGEPMPDERIFQPGALLELSALANGGVVVAVSDRHYGNPQNLLLPGRSTHMGDGWETRRRRGPGHDWAVIRLARRGVLERVELETEHFKGNAPGSCQLECCDAGESFDPATAAWRTLVEQSPLTPDAPHRWGNLPALPATHVRLNIYPDGGVARLRLFGRVTPAG